MKRRIGKIIVSAGAAALLLMPLSGKSLWAFDHGYAEYNSLLKATVIVDGGKSAVRYADIKKEPARLNRFVREIESVAKTEFDGWTRKQQMAFLINAYNALTIKLALTEYPDLESIRDLGGIFSSPWKEEFFTLFGEKRYLDYIEHETLRKDYFDARIHFVLVCASVSCPALRNEAYVAERLDRQMNDAMVKFLGDPDRNRFNEKENRLEISSIFKWYKKDFVRSAGSVEAFVAPWIVDDGALRRRIESREVDLEFLDYNWGLNDAAGH